MNAILPMACPQQATEPPKSDLEMLQCVAELATQLMELAARQAKEEVTTQPAQPLRPRRADPGLMFIRLARLVSDTITLKKRVAAGILLKAPRAPREPAPYPTPTPAAAEAVRSPEDPRRPLIIRYIREAAAQSSRKRKTPITPQAIETCVTAELAKDPQRKLPGHSVLLRICKSLDIPFYANRLPIDLLRPPQPIPIATP